MSLFNVLFASALLVGLSACSFVKVNSSGEQVRLATAYDLAGCQRLGSTVVSVKDSVLGIDRSAAKIDAELIALARNSAVDIGGDTVVKEENMSGGKQRFGVYKCR